MERFISFNPPLILIVNKGTTNIWNYTVFKHENFMIQVFLLIMTIWKVNVYNICVWEK